MCAKYLIPNVQLTEICEQLEVSKNIIEICISKYKGEEINKVQDVYLNYISRIYSNLISINILIKDFNKSDYLAQSYIIILRSGLYDFIQIQYLYCIYAESMFKIVPETETLGIYYSQINFYTNELNTIEGLLKNSLDLLKVDDNGELIKEELKFINEEKEQIEKNKEKLSLENIDLKYGTKHMLLKIASDPHYSKWFRVYMKYQTYSKVDHSGFMGHQLYQVHDKELLSEILYSLIIHHQALLYLIHLLPNDKSNILEINTLKSVMENLTKILSNLNQSK